MKLVISRSTLKNAHLFLKDRGGRRKQVVAEIINQQHTTNQGPAADKFIAASPVEVE